MNITKNSKTIRIISLFFITVYFSFLSFVQADSLATEKLLEILKGKGYLTEEEVVEIKGVLKEEEKKEIEIVYEEGLYLQKKDKSIDVRIGGLIQTDFRVFDLQYPKENKFDIRRARIILEGTVFDYFKYKLEAELEGSRNRRMVDGCIGFDYFPFLKLKLGQFKEPFSLEHLTIDKDTDFIERSMVFHLTPKRDMGFMIHGRLFDDAFGYGIGIFNGHGYDETGGEVGEDDKDICCRLNLKPFQWTRISFLKELHVGGSFAHAYIDRSDVYFDIETAGFTKFLRVTPRAKYYLLLDVDDRRRIGWELAWGWGPLVVKGEWVKNYYHELLLTSDEKFDFNMKAWYLSCLVMLTGEHPEMKGGVFERIRPYKDFSLKLKNWGALGLTFRLEKFNAERIIYDHLINEDYFVRGANAYTLGINWYLNSMTKVCLNYTHYSFSSPLYLGTDEKGRAMYTDNEDIFATRFQLEF
ncbi:MAG: porin [Thermodesulfobacteriota bacterium]|nr:porin [Thermodesulfobacteriota bacterium]